MSAQSSGLGVLPAVRESLRVQSIPLLYSSILPSLLSAMRGDTLVYESARLLLQGDTIDACLPGINHALGLVMGQQHLRRRRWPAREGACSLQDWHEE